MSKPRGRGQGRSSPERATGYLDSVTADQISGWSTASSVIVSVNGRDRISVRCDGERPDVREHGLSVDGRVGFSVPISLEPGDVVRVRTAPGGSTGERPLHHSPWLYAAGDGWLPASLAEGHPEYSAIARLAARAPFHRFRPLAGHRGEMVGAALEYPDGQRWVARWGLTARQTGDIRAIHEAVLDPAGLPVPALGTEAELDGERVVFFEDAGRTALDDLAGDWDPALRAILPVVARLHEQGEDRPRSLNGAAWRRAPAHPVLRLTRRHLSALGRYQGPAHRRTTLAMLATIPRLPRVLSHGDLHRKNVLIAGSGQPCLVDWDCWDYLPTGYDPAMLLRGLPAERNERLVDAIEWPLPHETRLGLVLFNYLQQTLDNPSLPSSEEGRYLRERFWSLTRDQGAH